MKRKKQEARKGCDFRRQLNFIIHRTAQTKSLQHIDKTKNDRTKKKG
jgi:hypothetical protein